VFGGTEDVAIADSIAADGGPEGEVMAMTVEDMINSCYKDGQKPITDTLATETYKQDKA
jgi:hypothetical protein